MPSVTHSLGELKHSDVNCNLKLRTRGYITFSSLTASHSSLLSVFSNPARPVLDNSWVFGDKGLQVIFNVAFNGSGIPGRDEADLVNNIGVVLSRAELWSQLGFKASARLNKIAPGSGVLVLNLQANSDQSSSANIKPPNDVLAVKLDSVQLYFDFTVPRLNEGTGCKNNEDFKSAPQFNADVMLLDQHPVFDRSDRGETLSCFDRAYASIKANVGSTTDITENSRSLGDGSDNSVSLDYDRSQETPASSQSSGISQSSLNLLTDAMRIFDEDEVPVHIRQPTHIFSNYVKLIDASLRGMIFEQKPQTSTSINLLTPATKHKLNDIAPALFSPGHLHATSKRVEYVPAIARSLVRVQQRAYSAYLKSKTLALLDSNVYQKFALDTLDLEDHTPASKTLFAAVEARVWMAMQRRLIDPSACKVLRHLNPAISKSETDAEQLMDWDLLFDEHPLPRDSPSEVTGLLHASQYLRKDEVCNETELLMEDDSMDLLISDELGDDMLMDMRISDEMEDDMLMDIDLIGECKDDEDLFCQPSSDFDESNNVFKDLLGNTESSSEHMLLDEREYAMALNLENCMDDRPVEENTAQFLPDDYPILEGSTTCEDELLMI